jgi:hypothetical protein
LDDQLKGAISVSDVDPLVATGAQAPRPKHKAKPKSPHPSTNSVRSQTQQQQLTVTGTPGAAGVAVAMLPPLLNAAATREKGAAIAADDPEIVTDDPEIVTDAPRHAPDSHEKERASVSTDHIDLTGAPRHAPDSERKVKAKSKANATAKPLVVTQQSAPEQTSGAFASEPPVELAVVGEAVVEVAAKETMAIRVGRSGVPQSEDVDAGAEAEAEVNREIAAVNEAMAALSEEVEAAEENEVAEAAEAGIDAVNEAMSAVSQEVIAEEEEEEAALEKAAEAKIEAANEAAGEDGAEGVEEDVSRLIVNKAMAVASEKVITAEESAEEEVELQPSEAQPVDNVVEAKADDEEPKREEQEEAAVGTEEGAKPEELDAEDSGRLEVEVESAGTEYPAGEGGRAMLPLQGQVEILEVNAVSKVPPSPRVLVRVQATSISCLAGRVTTCAAQSESQLKSFALDI